MLAQEGDDKDEKAMYYLSKRFHDYEIHTHREIMLRSCMGYTETKTYHLTIPSMDSCQNGPIEVPI